MPKREIRSFRGSRAEGHGSRCGRRISIGRNAARRRRFPLEVTPLHGSRGSASSTSQLTMDSERKIEQMIHVTVLTLCGLTVALVTSAAIWTENAFSTECIVALGVL